MSRTFQETTVSRWSQKFPSRTSPAAAFGGFGANRSSERSPRRIASRALKSAGRIGDPPGVSATRIACRSLALVLLALGLSTDGWAATKWIHLKSAHLEAVSDASEEEARSRMVVLERVRGVLPNGFLGQPVSGLPTRVLLLKDGQMVDRIIGGKRSSRLVKMDGGYIATMDENLILIDLISDRGNEGRISQHEFIHLLTRDNSGGWPLWLTEGIAQCFEQIEFKEDKAVFGMARPGIVEQLKDSTPVPWRDLMKFDRRHLASMSAEKAGSVYSQAWVLTHFLLYGQPSADRAKLDYFLDLVDRRRPAVEAMKEAYGWDPEQLKPRIQKYMKSGQFHTLAADMPKDLDLEVSVIPAPIGLAEAWVAQFEVVSGRDEVARRWLEVARKTGGASAWIALAEAQLAASGGDRKAAMAGYRRALELDSGLVQARVALAASLFPKISRPTTEDLDEIVSLLTGVVGQLPRHSVAWGMLGQAEIMRGQMDPAAKAFLQSLKYNPRNWNSRYNIAVLRSREGRFDVALAHLTNVIERADDPSLVALARDLAAEIREDQVEEATLEKPEKSKKEVP